jgi:hypothetical protein
MKDALADDHAADEQRRPFRFYNDRQIISALLPAAQPAPCFSDFIATG